MHRYNFAVWGGTVPFSRFFWAFDIGRFTKKLGVGIILKGTVLNPAFTPEEKNVNEIISILNSRLTRRANNQ